MIEVQGGTIRISAGTDAKTSHDYQTRGAHSSVSFEVAVPDAVEDLDALLLAAEDVFASLSAFTNAAVAAELGLELDDDGRVQVKNPQPSAPAPAPAAAPFQQPQGQQGGGARKPFSPPKVAKTDFQVVQVGDELLYDQRPFKANGTYKPGAADFRTVNGGESRWILGRDGTVTPFGEQVAEAGI